MRQRLRLPRLGMSLLETVVVLLIASVAITGLYAVIDSHQNDQFRLAASNQMKEVVAAAREHIQDRGNYVALLNNPGITTGVTINDVTVFGRPLHELQNIYQQGYEVRVRAINNAFGQRQLVAAVVTTGGEVLKPEDGNMIARAAGGRTGFVHNNLLYGPAAEMNLNLAHFGGVSNGRLFSAVLLSQSGDYNSDGLFREAIPGRPDLNTAQTDFQMNDNSVRNVLRTQASEFEITDVSGGESASSRQIQINEAEIQRVNADLMESRTLTTDNVYVTQGLGGRSNNAGAGAQGTLTGTGNATIEGDTHVHGSNSAKSNSHGVSPNAVNVPMREGINTRAGDIDTQGGDVYVHHIKASGRIEVANSGRFNLPTEEIGTACRHAGAVAIQEDILLVCRNGEWRSNLRADMNYGATNDGHIIDRTSNPKSSHYERRYIPGTWEACFLSAFQLPSQLGSMPGYGNTPSTSRQIVRVSRDGCCGGGEENDLYAETDAALEADFITDQRHAGDSTCYVGRDASGNWYAEHQQNNYVADHTWCHVGCVK